MLVLLLFPVFPPVIQDTKPHALVAFEEARKAILSGEIEYSISRALVPGSVQNYRTRLARNGDRIIEELGDQNGWTQFTYDAVAKKSVPFTKVPNRYMANREGFWKYTTTTTRAHLTRSDADKLEAWGMHAMDVRVAGMYTNGDELVRGMEILQGRDDQRTRIKDWSQVEQNGKFVVTGITESDARIVWTIDPKRGWNAERISVYADVDGESHLFNDCVISLSLLDGVWFPDSVTYTYDGKELMSILVYSRRLNSADDPKSFTGRELGLEAGMTVVPQDFQAQSRRGLRWCDEGLVEAKRWDQLERAGAQPGPTVLAERRGEISPLYTEAEVAQRLAARLEFRRSTTLRRHQTLWLAYVEWFIRKYELDDEQRQRAMSILSQCQSEAGKYIESKKVEIDKALETSLTSSSQPTAPHAQVAVVDELLKPVDEIFETRLKPRLAALPTREQKRKAEVAHSTTQPTTTQPILQPVPSKK